MSSRITADERSALLASLAELPPKHWLKGRNNRLRLEVWYTLNERMREIEAAIKRGENTTLMGRVLRDFYIKVFLIIRDNWGILTRVAEAENYKNLPATPEEAIAKIWYEECQLRWNRPSNREVSSPKFKDLRKGEERSLYGIKTGDPDEIAQAKNDLKYMEARELVSSELLTWCVGTLMRENNRKRDPALDYSIGEYETAILNIHRATIKTHKQNHSFAMRGDKLLRGGRGGKYA